jgi:hypothetical protein
MRPGFDCAIFEIGSRKRQRLLNVLGLEFRIIAKQIVTA